MLDFEERYLFFAESKIVWKVSSNSVVELLELSATDGDALLNIW